MILAKITRRHLGVLTALVATRLASNVKADTLPIPRAKVILTVSGNISAMNAAGEARYDLSMLEALGMITIETSTPWYNGTVKFEGVLLSDIMKSAGASGTTIVATALNDYTTEIPISDFERFRPILAIKRDGHYMPVRDKGPLFIVYPFDSKNELKSQIYYGRSAWQVVRLVVK